MDFVEKFLAYTEGRPCPVIFRKWAAISILGAAMERRVWITNAAGKVYPNLFVLLIAKPGIGKEQAMNPAVALLKDAGAGELTFGEHSMTKAAMLDNLVEGTKIKVWGDKKHALQYTSLMISVEELGTMISQYDKEIMSFITFLWNNPPQLAECRRHSTSVDIINPQINLLVGTQPGYIGSLFPEEMWEQGFASRIVMIHAEEAPKWDPWISQEDKSKLKSQLIVQLRGNLVHEIGPAKVSKEYQQATLAWFHSGMEPKPTHKKLTHYTTRRFLMCLKLSIIAAANRGDPKNIELQDFETAKGWMLEAERTMPRIFDGMVKKSDDDLLHELHTFITDLKSRRGSVDETDVYRFLADKVPVERVPRVLDIAIKAGILKTLGKGIIIPGIS